MFDVLTFNNLIKMRISPICECIRNIKNILMKLRNIRQEVVEQEFSTLLFSKRRFLQTSETSENIFLFVFMSSFVFFRVRI